MTISEGDPLMIVPMTTAPSTRQYRQVSAISADTKQGGAAHLKGVTFRKRPQP